MPFTNEQVDAIRLISQTTFEREASHTIKRQLWIIRWAISPLVAVGLLGGLTALFITVPDIAISRLFGRLGTLQSEIQRAVAEATNADSMSAKAKTQASMALTNAAAADALATDAKAAAVEIGARDLVALKNRMQEIDFFLQENKSAADIAGFLGSWRPTNHKKTLSASYVSVDHANTTTIGTFSKHRIVEIDPNLSIQIDSNNGAFVMITLTGTGISSPDSQQPVSDGHIRFWLKDTTGALVHPETGQPFTAGQDAIPLSGALYYRTRHMPPGWQPVVMAGTAEIPPGQFRIVPGYYAAKSGMRFHATAMEALVIPASAQSWGADPNMFSEE